MRARVGGCVGGCWSVLKNNRAGEREAAVLVGLVLSLVLKPTIGFINSSQARLQSHQSMRYNALNEALQFKVAFWVLDFASFQ